MPRFKIMKKRRTVSITLDEGDVQALKELAAAEEVHITEKVRRMILPFLSEYRKAKLKKEAEERAARALSHLPAAEQPEAVYPEQVSTASLRGVVESRRAR